ncbi:NfeD family protein [Polycladomyces subterraneus]|uniref:Nodulation protein NfeD n=1 Tax=Polycladomyces subterraneus TaxID=1016997 RepID=A0ABT8IJ99_9BACL|nr:NfeD family protein [Polycladomyces subterraneus]MDN4592863.1 nodulation protein NfeD [Polycladomyces subterraneus]
MGAGSALLVFFSAFLLAAELLVKARGLAGVAGLLLMGWYVNGHWGTTPGWWLAVLLVGMGLVILDGKLLQDGTLASIGAILVLVGLVIPTGNWLTGTLVAFAWMMGLALSPLSLKVLPKRDWLEKIVLKFAMSKETGYSSLKRSYQELVGLEGTALTDMRPAGTIRIGDGRYSAVTNGHWVDKGARVRVLSVDGVKILVETVEEPSDQITEEKG